MRHRALAVVLLLLISACGGGDDGSAAETTMVLPASTSTTSTSSSTTAPPTTTTLLSTTTSIVMSTTTTTVPPWTTLPDPGMPPTVWDAGSGNPIEIKSMCVEWVLDGSAPPDDSSEDALTGTLPLLGISVLPDGCDATLSVSLTGHRSSATYSRFGVNPRECWSGTSLTGQATLVIDGDVRHTWTVDRVNPPPESTSWCPEEDTSIPIDFEDGLWHDMFVGLLGNPANPATWLYITDRYTGMPVAVSCWEGPPTANDGQALASLLYRNERTRKWLSLCGLPEDRAGREALLPLVPYLIRSLDAAWSFDTVLSINTILKGVTGANFYHPGEWWAWWEEQQG